MEKPDCNGQRVSVGARGLLLRGSPPDEAAGEPLPLIGGAMHYFHLSRDRWERCLDRLAELELSFVETAVPWSVHETAPGHFDFGGADGDRRRDLGGFVAACAARQLKLVVRPGPYIGPELTGGGIPARLLADERCWARSAGGAPLVVPVAPRPFCAPSCASELFRQQTRAWLAALAHFLSAHRFPDGPLVGLRLGGERSWFYRVAAYAFDYHEDSIGRYRRWLSERYPQGLPAGYGEQAAAEVDPPRRFAPRRDDELVKHLDWMTFKDELLDGAIAEARETVSAGGCDGLPFFGDHATDDGICAGAPQLEPALELHLPRPAAAYQQVRAATALLAGSSALAHVAELRWGGSLWWPPTSREAQLSQLCGALMHGARGICLQMAVDRDRWFDAPVDARGERCQPRFDQTRAVVRALRDLRFNELSRDPAVAVLRVREYHQLRLCAALVDPLPAAALEAFGATAEQLCSDDALGLSGPVQQLAPRFEAEVLAILRDHAVVHDRVDSRCGDERLARYPLLLAPLFDFVDRGLLARLRAYVAAGGHLVVGPQRPRLDATMQPLAAAELPPMTVIESAEALVPLLERCEGERAPAAPPAATALSRGREGEDAALFVANPGAREERVSLDEGWCAARAARLWDGISGTPVDPQRIELAPQQVRLLRCREEARRR